MNFRTFLVACSLLLLGSHRSAADLTITQKVEGLGQDAETTSRFKDGKLRVDTSPGTSLIMVLANGDLINLNHAQRTFLKISGDTTKAAIESVRKSQAENPEIRSPLNATGKTETISGHPAEEYTCTLAGVKMALWLTKDLPDPLEALQGMVTGLKTGPMAGMLQNYGFDLGALPGFPIRIMLELPAGQTLTRTVTAVSTKLLPETDFEVPAGYTEVTPKILTPPAAQALPSPAP